MRGKQIKALVMDVDGTLTDGGIYMGISGEMMKRFDVRDGYAIKHRLPQYHIIPIIMTGRESDIVRNRCKELDIQYVIQNSRDKLKDLIEILQKEKILLEEVAFIGDDWNDMECMKAVGLKACPADAIKEIQENADYITECFGGYGAVREFIDWIIVTKEGKC